jgi:hypothetical protein
MPAAAANVSTARKKDMKDKVEKKDKKIEVSLTNWFLGGSLISGTSSTSSTRSGARRMVVVKSVGHVSPQVITISRLALLLHYYVLRAITDRVTGQ